MTTAPAAASNWFVSFRCICFLLPGPLNTVHASPVNMLRLTQVPAHSPNFAMLPVILWQGWETLGEVREEADSGQDEWRDVERRDRNNHQGRRRTRCAHRCRLGGIVGHRCPSPSDKARCGLPAVRPRSICVILHPN